MCNWHPCRLGQYLDAVSMDLQWNFRRVNSSNVRVTHPDSNSDTFADTVSSSVTNSDSNSKPISDAVSNTSLFDTFGRDHGLFK